MTYHNVEFSSLCQVKHYNNKIFLKRLADFKDKNLIIPEINETAPKIFENRDQIYYREGPSSDGDIGIWYWTAEPSYNRPDSDFVKSYYKPEYCPINIFKFNDITSDEDLLDKLKNGFEGQIFNCNTFFAYPIENNYYRGIFCKYKNLNTNNNMVKLNTDIYTLPVHEIEKSNILFIKNFAFLNSFSLPAESFKNNILVYEANEIIKTVLLEKFSWPFFKECINATKAEWRNCKLILEKLCDDTLYKDISKKLNCTEDEAKSYIINFIQNANHLIEQGDIDADILANIVLYHNGLRKQCEKSIEAKWKTENANIIAEAENKINEIKETYQSIKKENDNLTQKNNQINSEITSSAKHLENLKNKIKKYEEIGNSTVEAVRQKIVNAQNDIGKFISDISIFMPLINTNPEINTPVFKEYSVKNLGKEIELTKSWEDDFSILTENLCTKTQNNKSFITENLSRMLTAFIYSAHINHIPLLLAGPCGNEIAIAYSTAIYGKQPGILSFESDYNQNIIKSINNYNNPVLIIENIFSHNLSDTLPQYLMQSNKDIFLTHPYTDDLLIEPKGLYNYMLPVFTEIFVEGIPNRNFIYAQRDKSFNEYKKEKFKPFIFKEFSNLKLSKFLLNRLEIVLSDAKQILSENTNEKILELLFGLLPLSILNNRIDILNNMLEDEPNISSEIKEIIARYIEED